MKYRLEYSYSESKLAGKLTRDIEAKTDKEAVCKVAEISKQLEEKMKCSGSPFSSKIFNIRLVKVIQPEISEEIKI